MKVTTNVAKCMHVARNRKMFYFWQHVPYKIKVTTNVASNMLPSVCLALGYHTQGNEVTTKFQATMLPPQCMIAFITTKLPATCCLVYGGLLCLVHWFLI